MLRKAARSDRGESRNPSGYFDDALGFPISSRRRREFDSGRLLTTWCLLATFMLLSPVVLFTAVRTFSAVCLLAARLQIKAANGLVGGNGDRHHWVRIAAQERACSSICFATWSGM